MATTKRQRQYSAANRPANTAGQPTISVRVERTAQSLSAERQALTMRRAKWAIGLALPAALIAGLLIVFQPFARPATNSAAPVAQQLATSAPAIQAPATAAPALAIQPTVAPALAIQPTTAPAQPTAPPAAVVAPQPAAAPAAAAATIACDAIAGLPIYTGATCVKRDIDTDDGVTKAKNSYTTTGVADEVRRFYEGAFAKDGWTLQEFAYTTDLGTRRVKVQAEAKQGASGAFTKIQLTEYGAAAGARSSCVAIEGLSTFPNAQCSDFDTDLDNGVTKAEYTYTTSASPEEIRHFYENTFKQNSWIGQDFTYDIAQGQRSLQVDVETKSAPSGAFTAIKIAE